MASQIKAAQAFVVANCPELASTILDLNGARKVHDIYADMASRLIKWGSLSEKQVAFARRLHKEHQERLENNGMTAREAQWAKEKELAQDCPEGRAVVTGKVISRKLHESRFGTSWKITVKDDRGFVVWMTEPSNLDCEKGDRVEVTVSVTPSDRDAKFGFGKRSSNARMVQQAASGADAGPADDGKAVCHDEYREPALAAPGLPGDYA